MTDFENFNLILDGVAFHYFNLKNVQKKNEQELVDCFIDINCPEGACWHNESNGVANLINQTGTGILLNNLQNNKKPYVIV